LFHASNLNGKAMIHPSSGYRHLERELESRLDGLDPAPGEALRETLLETYLFAGYPRAINALAELAALLPQPDPPETIDLTPRGEEATWVKDGQALCRRVYGERYDRLLKTMAHISPELGRWMVMEGYGKVLSRPGLDARTRELTAVAALLPLSVPNQLRAHLRGSLLVGASPEDIEDVLRVAALIHPEGLEEAMALLVRVREELNG
jgi:4-carboxymuconolactone decarboxylase